MAKFGNFSISKMVASTKVVPGKRGKKIIVVIPGIKRPK